MMKNIMSLQYMIRLYRAGMNVGDETTKKKYRTLLPETVLYQNRGFDDDDNVECVDLAWGWLLKDSSSQF